MWGLFFAFFLEVFKKVAMGAEAIFTIGGIFEKKSFEWL